MTPVVIRNWCCSFTWHLLWYETDAVVSIFSVTKLRFDGLGCLVLCRGTWPVKDWKRFPLASCILVYLWDCLQQHGGSGKRRASSAWSTQPVRPLNSTDPETVPFDQRLGRRIFPPVNLGQSNFRLFMFLARLGLQTSNLGQCGTASSVVPKESPCTFSCCCCCCCLFCFFCCNHEELFIRTGVYVGLIPFECKLKGNNCIKRILWSLAQLYTLVYVLRTAFPHCDQWLEPSTVCQCTDALLCSSVYRHRIDTLQDSMNGWWMRTLKRNSGSREHLSQYHVLMCMHYCRLCTLNLCGCCMCCTRYCCHTPQWTNTSQLPSLH